METTNDCEGEWKPVGYGDHILRCTGCFEWLVIIDGFGIGLASADASNPVQAWVVAQAVKITVEATS